MDVTVVDVIVAAVKQVPRVFAIFGYSDTEGERLHKFLCKNKEYYYLFNTLKDFVRVCPNL